MSMAGVPMLGGAGAGVAGVAWALGKAAGILGLVLLVARRVMPKVLEAVARTCSQEIFVLAVMAICFGTAYLTRLVVKNAGRVIFVRADEIDWIEAADYYVRLHVARKSHLLRETMSALEIQLDPARFFRVHRSAIVNLDRLVEIQPYFHGEHILVLQDGSKLKLSRSRKEKLEAVLRQSI